MDDKTSLARELLGNFFFRAHLVSGPLRSRSLRNNRRADRSADRLRINALQTQAVSELIARKENGFFSSNNQI